jgi:Family of unknown function (DUF5995)
MFAYDSTLLAAVQAPVNAIADVLQLMRNIDAMCIDGDGLKWFNWEYMQVTSAVEARVPLTGSFADPRWISELDVQFARLYFGALEAWLTGADCPSCWQALFSSRGQVQIARIQFALAGINAHINHDLPEAIVATCKAMGTGPRHGTEQYVDYTAVNTTLDGLIDEAKRTLNVRLLGDALPPVSHLEDLLAAWSVSAAREKAWLNSEVLWHLDSAPDLANGFMDSLDGLTAFAGKALLIPVP